MNDTYRYPTDWPVRQRGPVDQPASDLAPSKAHRWAQPVESLIRRYPGVGLAAALAIGIGIGLLIKRR